MTDNHTVNGAIGSDGNAIDDAIDWIPKKFEAGNKSDV
jgi:hypothetical protein